VSYVAAELRRIGRNAARHDFSGIKAGFAFRCAAGIGIVLIAGLLLGKPLDAVAAAISGLPVGFASRQGVYRTRATVMLLTALGMAFSAFTGSLTGGDAILNVAVAGGWGLFFGLFASLGASAVTIGQNSCVALAIFSHFHYGPRDALVEAAFVLAGGAVQTALLVLVWPLQRFPAERRVLAKAYRALAVYANDIASDELRTPSVSVFTELRAVVDDPQPFARRGETAVFEILLDEAERVRETLGALAVDRFALARQGNVRAASAVRALGATTHDVLVEIATALEAARAPAGSEVWLGFEESLGRIQRDATHRTLGDAQALLGQLRSAWRAASMPGRGGSLEPGGHTAALARPSWFADAARTLRANCSPTSEYGQHAVRLAVALMLASIASRAFTLERGYWAPLTAALVLRPDYTATFSRGVARIAGTLLGALVAASIVVLFHPGPPTYLALALVFATFCYAVFDVNYGAFTIGITGYVVFLLAYAGFPEQAALLPRVEATIVGGAIALATYAAWPTWGHALVPARLAELLERQRAYLHLLLAACSAPSNTARQSRAPYGALREAQRAAWLARTNAEVSVDRLLNEPVPPKALTGRTALSILAASRRVGLASLTIRARLERGTCAFESDAFWELAAALDGALAALARALRERSGPPAPPPLRALHTALAASLAGGSEEAEGLLVDLDIMVDAIDTMYDRLRWLRTAERTEAGTPADGDALAKG